MNEGFWEYLAVALSMLVIYMIPIIIAIILSKKLKKHVMRHNAGKVATIIAVSLILCFPFAIGQGIYVALKWNNVEPDYPYGEDYERWRQQKLQEQQDTYEDKP